MMKNEMKEKQMKIPFSYYVVCSSEIDEVNVLKWCTM